MASPPLDGSRGPPYVRGDVDATGARSRWGHRVSSLTEDAELRLLLTLVFRDGSADTVIEVLRPNAALTREEEGCLDFQVFQVDGADATFVIFEHWRSQADLVAHWAKPYMKDVFALFDTHLVRPLSDSEDVIRLTDVMAEAS